MPRASGERIARNPQGVGGRTHLEIEAGQIIEGIDQGNHLAGRARRIACEAQILQRRSVLHGCFGREAGIAPVHRGVAGGTGARGCGGRCVEDVTGVLVAAVGERGFSQGMKPGGFRQRRWVGQFEKIRWVRIRTSQRQRHQSRANDRADRYRFSRHQIASGKTDGSPQKSANYHRV